VRLSAIAFASDEERDLLLAHVRDADETFRDELASALEPAPPVDETKVLRSPAGIRKTPGSSDGPRPNRGNKK